VWIGQIGVLRQADIIQPDAVADGRVVARVQAEAQVERRSDVRRHVHRDPLPGELAVELHPGHGAAG